MRSLVHYSLVAGLALLSSCSSPINVPLEATIPAHEVHFLRGSYQYIGDEIPTAAPTHGVRKLIMPMPIRRLLADNPVGIRASSDDKILKVQATDRLAQDGTSLNVQLIDGRAIPFLIFPSTTAFRERPQFAAEAATPRAQLRGTSMSQQSFSVSQFLNRIGETEANPKGFESSFRYFGKLVIDDGTLRGMLAQSFIGKKFTVHVLDVQNMSDLPQELSSELFPFKGLLAVKFTRRRLEPYAMGAGAGKNYTKAYVLVENPQA